MSNEYSDQSVWFRVESRIPGRTGWSFEGDYDDREHASTVVEADGESFPDFEYRIRRMSDLGA